MSNWPEKEQIVENPYEPLDFEENSERNEILNKKLLSEKGDKDKLRLHIEAQVPKEGQTRVLNVLNL